jgi:hypothetical protein
MGASWGAPRGRCVTLLTVVVEIDHQYLRRSARGQTQFIVGRPNLMTHRRRWICRANAWPVACRSLDLGFVTGLVCPVSQAPCLKASVQRRVSDNGEFEDFR